uniref:SSD domain-containing protein n=1 Tax=Panagrolaimus superbus TaxID=310955 RepID=A0A914ZAF6_9BILA
MSFTIGSCMTGDWITSKPLEALMGIFVSSLAIFSAGGLLFALGIPYISQVTVMPFLAFTIGVDDTYVMLGAWQDTKRNLPPEKRMALALEEAGSAISVTSLTSVISFGIGTFSTTPAISIFCKFIAVAIAFDWFYQVTFFAGVMALGGKREAAGYHCFFVWRQMPKDQIALSKSTLFTSPTHKIFSDYIAPFLCKPATRISFFGIYAVYIYFAFYGCSLLRPNLTPSRLLVDDSPLIYYLKMAESRIWSEGVVGRVYVNNAPDLSTFPEKMESMLKLIEDLENTKYSMGPNSTAVWLREFNNYRQYFAEENENFYETFRSFLKISFNKQWNSFIKWADNPNRPGKQFVQKFFFTTAFKIPDWNARTELLLEWRNITSNYPEFQALVFDENNFFSDQMLELKSTTLSSLGTAIIAMIIVCILFIANSQIVFWVVFILVSMDIGVAGYLSLWGADLEPATVVNILMSISLCIDFATHVGYRIYRSPYTDPDKRISDALGAIGWPVVQAGFSTLLGIIVMILVPSNAVRMFARTNVLVVATGLFHGVFLLPIIIRSFASDFIGIPSKTEKNFKTT